MEGQGEGGEEDAGMRSGQGRGAEREKGSEERESKMEKLRKTGERDR